jgi:hypothetical protein
MWCHPGASNPSPSRSSSRGNSQRFDRRKPLRKLHRRNRFPAKSVHSERIGHLAVANLDVYTGSCEIERSGAALTRTFHLA